MNFILNLLRIIFYSFLPKKLPCLYADKFVCARFTEMQLICEGSQEHHLLWQEKEWQRSIPGAFENDCMVCASAELQLKWKLEIQSWFTLPNGRKPCPRSLQKETPFLHTVSLPSRFPWSCVLPEGAPFPNLSTKMVCLNHTRLT